MTKIKKLTWLKREVKRLKRAGKRIAFTNGCFDIIHPGHIKILKYAKSKGDILIVGLNTDASIQRIKGPKRPIMDEWARANVLCAMGFVDYVILFREDTPYKLIKELKPDYLVKGGDWQVNQIIGREFVKKIFRVKHYPDYSTTGIVQKIKNA